MAKNADDLAFDPNRLAVVGGSAGGGLTIATTMMARDKGLSQDLLSNATVPND